MCAAACLLTAAMCWMSCSTPILRIMTRTSITGEIVDSHPATMTGPDAFIVRTVRGRSSGLAVRPAAHCGRYFRPGAPAGQYPRSNLMAHHDVDIQWGNHDVVWMGAAAGSPVCVLTVVQNCRSSTTTSTLLENGYGINLRRLAHVCRGTSTGMQRRGGGGIPMARDENANEATLMRVARHAQSRSLSCCSRWRRQVIAAQPGLRHAGTGCYIKRIDYAAGTVCCGGKKYTGCCDNGFPTVDPACPARHDCPGEQEHSGQAGARAFRESERLQRHIQFLYAHGRTVQGHQRQSAVTTAQCPMTADGQLCRRGI